MEDNSGKSIEYFKHQARQILGAAVNARSPRTYRAAREMAARKLIADFLELAREQDLQQGLSDEGGKEAYIAASDTSSVRITTNGGGGIYMRLQDWSGSSTESKVVDLDFDYVTRALVGKAYDDDVAPAPGERRPRVHALVAMAVVAAELIGLEANG